jgi:putative spermidine/putrescine transport system ATP-binding protein
MVDGRDVTRLPPYARRMGVVFQSYALFPHMTVAANVAFGLRMQGVASAERARRAAAALAMVGLSDHAHKRPRQMSGGQQQRVALARALAIEPDVLLRVEMRILQRRVGATAVFVTHDQAEALAMADLVAVMDSGRVAQLGSPEQVFERPATPFVAEFVGRSARFSGIAEAGGVRVEGLLLRCAPPAPGPARVFVRPHRIALLGPDGVADNAIEGVVAALDYTGEIIQVVVDTALGRVPVDVSTVSPAWRGLQPGAPVRVGWAAEDTLCFPV